MIVKVYDPIRAFDDSSKDFLFLKINFNFLRDKSFYIIAMITHLVRLLLHFQIKARRLRQ